MRRKCNFSDVACVTGECDHRCERTSKITWNDYPQKSPVREDKYLVTVIIDGKHEIATAAWVMCDDIGTWLTDSHIGNKENSI